VVGAAIATLLIFPLAAAAAPSRPIRVAYPAADPGHAAVLNAALARMIKQYPAFHRSPLGPTDVLDYRVADLWRKGIDGTGTTVAVIEGWDDPSVASVVHDADQRWGLPDPRIDTIYPAGKLPARCPAGMVALGSYGSCEAWRYELDLDVLSVHLLAPYAKILISATPADTEIADDPAAQVAPPEMMRAVADIASHHRADVISISDGTGESTYSYGRPEITAQDVSLLTAAAAGVPVVVATGDCGVLQNLATANSQCGSTTATPDTSAWDDSPWTTAVGGSMPDFDQTGRRRGADVIWQDEGAGYSSVYSRPGYQDIVASVTDSPMRSVPDITMDARSGTSEAAPLFAAVLALATQLNGGPIGPVNEALYRLGPRQSAAGIADITKGNDSVFTSDANSGDDAGGGDTKGSTADDTTATTTNAPKVLGFAAGPGFDVASGWGTVDASRFVPALLLEMRADPDSEQRHAATALAALRHNLVVSRSAAVTYLLGSGFLPLHPVRLTIDNQPPVTLVATPLGQVTYSTDLPRGAHAVRLAGMLQTLAAVVKS
jgi:subtilase family serine protease